jgi:hypothetical protein
LRREGAARCGLAFAAGRACSHCDNRHTLSRMAASG